MAGCDAAPESARGLGLADGVIGSCEDACGEASPNGNCWCDAACAEHGDCCADKVDACGGAPADPAEPVLCRVVDDCPSGLMCDDMACYSGCRDGEACEDDCLGMCVEPQQQTLPSPGGQPSDSPADDPNGEPPTDPGGTSPDDSDSGEDEGPVCSCPADELCVPLCPVCPDEVPEEECQCITVCVRT